MAWIIIIASLGRKKGFVLKVSHANYYLVLAKSLVNIWCLSLFLKMCGNMEIGYKANDHVNLIQVGSNMTVLVFEREPRLSCKLVPNMTAHSSNFNYRRGYNMENWTCVSNLGLLNTFWSGRISW